MIGVAISAKVVIAAIAAIIVGGYSLRGWLTPLAITESLLGIVLLVGLWIATHPPPDEVTYDTHWMRLAARWGSVITIAFAVLMLCDAQFDVIAPIPDAIQTCMVVVTTILAIIVVYASSRLFVVVLSQMEQEGLARYTWTVSIAYCLAILLEAGSALMRIFASSTQLTRAAAWSAGFDCGWLVLSIPAAVGAAVLLLIAIINIRASLRQRSANEHSSS